MDGITVLGFVAGILTTVSFVPQVIKIWNSKSARDVSLSMFLILACGIAMWVVYGLTIKSLPVITANIVTLVLASIIIYFKIRYK